MTLASSKTYRGDIDGLRTIAIVGVMLFHFRLGPFAGGYAGVDVFLVISGFLIAGLLDAANRQDRFSVGDFFERRARRIVPALFFVLLCCDLASLRLLPNDMKAIGSGLMNAALFTSNFFLSSLAQDYFAAGSVGTQPELHTWSVSLEAQFYVLFALVFAATRRSPLLLKAAFAALALASLAASVFGTARWPAQAFYLLPARLWEFLAGAAVYASGRTSRGRSLAAGGPFVPALAGGLGVALIVLSYCLYSPATPFPGIAAAMPCLGAMLIIAAGARRNRVTAWLAARPLPEIGRLSYSLYLWHWPLLVFASYGRAEPLALPERLGLLAATFVLAALSRAFIERPIIERRWFATPRSAAAFCCAAGVGVLAVALVVNLAGQKIISFTLLPKEVLALSDGQFDDFRGNCGANELEKPPCRFGFNGPGAPAPSVLLWGNSFARMWLPALDAAARRHGLAGQSFLLTECPPLLGAALARVAGCKAFNRDVAEFLDSHPGITTVVLGGDWNAWMKDLSALGPTIHRLSLGGRRVVFVMTPPTALYDVPRTLALAKLRDAAVPLQSREAAVASRREEKGVVDRIRQTDAFDIINPLDKFCGSGDCEVEHDGIPLYHDQEHVTRYAANLFSDLFDAALQPPPATTAPTTADRRPADP